MLEEASGSAAAVETPQVRPGRSQPREIPVPSDPRVHPGGAPGDPVFPQEPAGAGALLAELSERAELYRAALGNAERENGNGARLRRLQRGLKVSPNPWNWGFGHFGPTLSLCP